MTTAIAPLKSVLPAGPTCAFCGEPQSEDSLCYGCKHYVCADCDKLEPFGASHNNVADHQTRRAGVLFGADE